MYITRGNVHSPSLLPSLHLSPGTCTQHIVTHILIHSVCEWAHYFQHHTGDEDDEHNDGTNKLPHDDPEKDQILLVGSGVFCEESVNIIIDL